MREYISTGVTKYSIILFCVSEVLGRQLCGSQLVYVDSNAAPVYIERHEQAFFASVEAQSKLVVLVSDVADPVPAIPFAHCSYNCAGNLVELRLLQESGLKRFLGVERLVFREMPPISHGEVVESHRDGQL